MKKLNILLFTITAIFFNVIIVKAACDSKERLKINTAASNVEMDYNITTNVIDLEGNIVPDVKIGDFVLEEGSPYSISDKVTVTVNNITDKIYVIFHSDDDNIDEEYHYEDLENGSFTYEVADVNKIRTYTLTVYSDVTGCLDEEINKFEIKTPKYNSYADLEVCQNNNEYYCKKYLTSDIEIPDEIFNIQRENQNNGNELEENKKNNKVIMIIGGIVIVGLLGGISYILIKKRIRRKAMLKIIGGMK